MTRSPNALVGANGCAQVELMFSPGTLEALEALAPVVELARADS